MKYFSLLLLFWSNLALACNWQTDIKENSQGYEYTQSCHIAVGQMKEDLRVEVSRNALLKEALADKDLALTLADRRAEEWMQTSVQLENSLLKADKMHRTTVWLAFGAGVLAVVATGAALHQAMNR